MLQGFCFYGKKKMTRPIITLKKKKEVTPMLADMYEDTEHPPINRDYQINDMIGKLISPNAKTIVIGLKEMFKLHKWLTDREKQLVDKTLQVTKHQLDKQFNSTKTAAYARHLLHAEDLPDCCINPRPNRSTPERF